ncbi:MAG: hypothetical protein ACK4PR_06475 [Gammaproteobacteria bacterium]
MTVNKIKMLKLHSKQAQAFEKRLNECITEENSINDTLRTLDYSALSRFDFSALHHLRQEISNLNYRLILEHSAIAKLIVEINDLAANSEQYKDALLSIVPTLPADATIGDVLKEVDENQHTAHCRGSTVVDLDRYSMDGLESSVQSTRR